MGDYTRKSQFELRLNVKEKLLFGNVIGDVPFLP